MLKTVINEKLVKSGKGNNNLYKEIFKYTGGKKVETSILTEGSKMNKLEEVSEELKELEE